MVIQSKTPNLFIRASSQYVKARLKEKSKVNKCISSQGELQEGQFHEIALEMSNENFQERQLTNRLDYNNTKTIKYPQIAYFTFNQNGIINQVNLQGDRLFGCEKTSLVGKLFSNFVTAQHKDVFNNCLAKAFEDDDTKFCEIILQTDKCKMWVQVEANPEVKNKNSLTRIIDITETKLAGGNQILVKIMQEKLVNVLALAASAFVHAGEAMIITDVAGTIIDVNDAFISTTGYSREEVIEQDMRILQSCTESQAFYIDMWQKLLDEGCWSGEVWNRRKNGDIYSEKRTISALRNELDIITHFVILCTDITQIKEHQNELEQIAYYDILTKLPNRSLLADRLSQAMLLCNRHDQSLAVLFLDLDGFKRVNDLHGHAVGDKLLVAISQRMKDVLREGDTLARIGGDEFVAILTNLVKVEDCEPILERFLLAASEPTTVGDVVLKVSASIGVTLYPQNSVKADQLLQHADQAMYVAKESGKNCYHLFDDAQDDVVKEQRKNLKAIRKALDNHQFVLYYQPKVNMRTGAVIGVEALIRWQHPKRGLLNPVEFLSVIENNLMSIEMDEWVMSTSLAQISQWQKLGLNLPVSINVRTTTVQLQQPDFTTRLTVLLAAHPDVEPHYLELEVLETNAIENEMDISTIMDNCVALGVNFSLDDFGKGHSSLTYIRQTPVSQIKIDQSFVRNMLIDPNDFAIVEGAIAVAKSFKREVIAEGVETIEHGIALLQMGCELAQGYGIVKPMSASNIPGWINDWKPHFSWQS